MDYAIRKGLVRAGLTEYVIFNRRTGQVVKRGFQDKSEQVAVDKAKKALIDLYNRAKFDQNQGI